MYGASIPWNMMQLYIWFQEPWEIQKSIQQVVKGEGREEEVREEEDRREG